MPVVGSILIFTPIWIKVCNSIIEILPTNISLKLLFFVKFIFFKTLYDKTKYSNIIPNKIITPNSSAITEII